MARKKFTLDIPNPFYRDEDVPRWTLPRWLRYLIPNPGTIVLLLLLLAVPTVRAGVLGVPLAAPSAAPSSATSINYQGRLFDQGTGNPITGAVNLEFVIYDAATNGNVIWGPEAHNSVTVNDGLFDVALGNTIPLSPSLFGQDRWLETSVGGETLSPRQQLLSVPVAQYAFQAQDALQAQTALQADEALGVPAGAIGSREFAPVIFQMDSGFINIALTNSYAPYVSMTVKHDVASEWIIWWNTATSKTSGTGLSSTTLYADGQSLDFIWGQHATSGTGGSSTGNGMLIIELTPGVEHTLTIYASGANSVLRKAEIIAMPITQALADQNCSGWWESPSHTDAISGGTISDTTDCKVYNLPFTAP